MFGISAWELLLVGVVLFLVVGPAKLPGLAKQIGNGVKDLRKGLGELKGTVDKDDEFVKAVGEARRTIAEAKADLRSLIDVSDDDDDDDEGGGRGPGRRADGSWDPAPKQTPRGLQRVGGSGTDGDDDGDDSATYAAAQKDPGATPADGGGDPIEEQQSRPTSKTAMAEGVPDEPTADRPTGRTGRKMIRPGRSSPNPKPAPHPEEDEG